MIETVTQNQNLLATECVGEADMKEGNPTVKRVIIINVNADDRDPDHISATWKCSLGGHGELKSEAEQYLGRT